MIITPDSGWKGGGGGVVRSVTGNKVNTINNLFNASFLKPDTLQITE
jgi:hypothetical protein